MPTLFLFPYGTLWSMHPCCNQCGSLRYEPLCCVIGFQERGFTGVAMMSIGNPANFWRYTTPDKPEGWEASVVVLVSRNAEISIEWVVHVLTLYPQTLGLDCDSHMFTKLCNFIKIISSLHEKSLCVCASRCESRIEYVIMLCWDFAENNFTHGFAHIFEAGVIWRGWGILWEHVTWSARWNSTTWTWHLLV